MKTTLLNFLFVVLANATFAQSPGNCLQFDGVNDNVVTSLPAVFNTISSNDHTIEAWVYPEGNVFSRIVFAQLNSSNFVTMSIAGGNVIYFYVNNTSSAVTNAGIPANQWTHVACVWKATTQQIEIYFNGVLQSTIGGGTSSVGNDNSMTIGCRNNNAQFFPGRLDEVRIWNVARTPCQILSSMTSEYTLLPSNLVAYYNFNQGVAAGTNTGVVALPDLSTNYNGTLSGFALSGAASNWIASGATITATNDPGSAVYGTDTQVSCTPLLWIDGNTYTTDNNTATYTYVGGSAIGCDSIVTLNLTILPLSTGTDTQTSCSPYLWIDGNTYTTDNTTATFTYPAGAANGCDSIVTLNLTVTNLDITTSVNANAISSNAVGATYQWLDCSNSFSAIPGATNATYSPSINGNYAVQVTNGACVDTSACVAIATIGLNDYSLGNLFRVYPNPTNGKITVQFTDVQETIAVKLYTLGGQLVQNSTVAPSSSFEMNIDQPAGVYLLELTSKEGEKAHVRIEKL